jgi:phosphatidate cytidylyltransferase
MAERASADEPAERGRDKPEEAGALSGRGSVGVGRDLRQAVLTSVVLLVVVILCYWGGPDWFFWLAAAVVLLAAFELLDAVKRSGRRPVVSFGVACVFGMMFVAYWYPDRPELLVAVAGVATFGSFGLALRPGPRTTTASDVAWTVLSVAWIGGGGAAAVSILTLSSGLNLLLAHVLVTALDDIGAYFAGTRFGRTKLAPSISPSKTWEGFAGGFVLALAGGGAAGLLINDLGVAHGLVIGVINGLLAPVGDLAESMAKRELGIKDSGRLLPGHGGFLDRLDAIAFTAPAVLGYLRAVVH